MRSRWKTAASRPERAYWAPECIRYHGAFYLITTFASAERKKGIYALKSESPLGPFEPHGERLTPADWSCIDGTVYFEEDTPWLIFSHSFEDSPTGDMCALPLKADLSGPAGEPVLLFSAFEAPWARPVPFAKEEFGMEGDVYFTDGPCVKKLPDGRLIMAQVEAGTLDPSMIEATIGGQIDAGIGGTISTYMGFISVGALISMMVLMPIFIRLFKTGWRTMLWSQILTVAFYLVLFFTGRMNFMYCCVMSFLAAVVGAMVNAVVNILVNDTIDFVMLKEGKQLNAVVSAVKGFAQKCGTTMVSSGLENTDNNYGDRMAVIAELHLEYADGSEDLICTDEGFAYCPSNIVESGIYFGETVDETLHETEHWKPVSVIADPEADAGTRNLRKDHLTDRLSLPVVVKEKLPVREIIRTPAGETVLDFGQNFAGFPEFKASLPRGTRITLDFGEILQQGNFYRGNYREANSQFVYVSDAKLRTVHPHFTFFGFCYVRVTGWVGALTGEMFRGCVLYSDMDRAGTVRTGNPKIDRLYENTVWGLKSNFLDMPTDCPRRNERLGWTGDAQIFAPTASYHMDTRAFFHKFEQDLMDEQGFLNGAVPNYVANTGHEAGAYIDTVLDVLREDRPDAILHDFAGIAGTMAADVLKVPNIMPYTSYPSNDTYSVAESFSGIPADHPLRIAADEIPEGYVAKYGCRKMTVKEIFDGQGDLNLVMMQKRLVPNNESFGDNFVFTGVQIGKRSAFGSWKAPDNGKPLLYSSLGTAFNNWPEYYPILFDAVRDLDINVFAALGAIDPETLHDVPANVELGKMVPQLDILSQASVFITHAGMGGTGEAIYYGVPMIAIPQMDEQAITAGQIEKNGLGIAFLDKSAITSEALKAAIQKLLEDPSYRNTARDFSEDMRSLGGAQASADAIIRFLEK